MNAIDITDVTGFPEICDGRVKTLHPKVHGGLLARRDIPEHMDCLAELGIEKIDLVCVNLYPFEATIAREDATPEMAVENIDIGGPSMLRSAAKNFASVSVVCDPSDYAAVLDEIKTSGDTTFETRRRLSAKAFTHTALYDSRIAEYMRRLAGLPEMLFLDYELEQPLRYGENPHQSAAFYKSAKDEPYSLAGAKLLGGKQLSYNNLRDANAALELVAEFDKPFCAALKHLNPCGAAIGKDAADAWKKALDADNVSVFGGVVVFNRPVTLEVAELLKPIFLEIIIAPEFTDEALELLHKKKNLRLLQVDMSRPRRNTKCYTSVIGGMLAQDADIEIINLKPEMCVTECKPDEALMSDLDFAWRIVKHVKSNAIVVVADGVTLGVGAGQMNRVGSAAIALEHAKSLRPDAQLVLASDGFLPFDDTVRTAAEYGVRAIVQPGGSVRDEDSIKAANELGIPMMFTGMRHFLH